MATINQKIIFKNTAAKKLYSLYMDPTLHGMITNMPVTISERPGSRMKAFGGYITGKTLQTVKDKLIVQQWRGSDWTSKDGDSAFVISLTQKGKDTTLWMTHANVPEKHAGHLAKGWFDHYWNPWKHFLTGKSITRPRM
jgi:activator of HSP90 ATPase